MTDLGSKDRLLLIIIASEVTVDIQFVFIFKGRNYSGDTSLACPGNFLTTLPTSHIQYYTNKLA